MKQLEHKDITLGFRASLGLEVTCSFNDLQDFLEDVKWATIKTLTITDVPVYRDEKFEDTVTRYIYNEQEIHEKENINRNYEFLIFGE